jgi:hypothetical protein
VNPWVNFIGYQVTWLIVVSSAGHAREWIGLLAAAAFILWQLATSTERMVDTRLIVAAVVLGTLVDGALSLLGWLRYAAASPALPPGGAPAWILGLWICFALTMTRSLQWLQGRPWLGMVLGAIGAPLAYLSAARGWEAVRFPVPAVRGIAGLAVGWAVATPVLLSIAHRSSARSDSAPDPQVTAR